MSANMLMNNTEIVEKKVDIEQAIARMRRPLEGTTVNVEVYGVYSMPDQWKTKIDDPGEQLYQYELEVCGMSLKHAKAFAREMTEEEKAEIEAAKNVKGKPPPKDPKKKEEEPSKEEVERVEREKREREERERKVKEEWDALDEDTKFYRKNEDIYKEPCLKFHNTYAVKRLEQLKEQLSQTPDSQEETRRELQDSISSLSSVLFVGNIATEKQGLELVEFEEFVSQDKGCWIRFNKLPPPEEEILDPKAAAAAKKAPPKGGKGGAVEDLKPFFGKAWLDFEDLLQPGSIETKQRVYLKTCPPLVKKMGDDGVERYAPAEDYENVFETNKTYIYIKVTLTDPITATIPEFPEPLPHEVVPVKQFIRWPFSKDPTDDFKKQITLAVESLAKEYYTMFQNELETEARGQKSENELQDSFEERKKDFLFEINTSGKYHILKEKLKKTIVRIVKEHFQKQGSIKGLYKDERDHFYSQLYAYLVQQMRQTVQGMVSRKMNELHKNVTVPQEQFLAERDKIIESETQEQYADRQLRLASEYENLYCSYQEAEQFMQKYTALYEGDPQKMNQMGKFYLRINKLEKAEEYLRDSYSFQIKNQNVALNYACFLMQMNSRNKEAIVILNKLALEGFEEVQVNLLISIAYDQDSDPLMAQKYRAIAFVKKLRKLDLIPNAGSSYEHQPESQPPVKIIPGQQQQQQHDQQQVISNRVESAPAYHNKRLNQQQQDQIYLDLAEILSSESLSMIAHKVISYVVIQDNERYWQTLGTILMQKRNYEDAIQAYNWLINKDPNNLEALGNLGHCYYFLKRSEAEEIYIKCIRLSTFLNRDLSDEYVLQRLAAFYLRLKNYNEAFEVIVECLLKYKNSFSHYNAGICHLLTTNYERKNHTTSYYLLQKANQLDPSKPEIYGYATLAALDGYQLVEAFQMMKEAFKLKLCNYELLRDIGKHWIEKGQRKDLYIECYEQSLRARAIKDSIRHQKKLEEFLKGIKGLLTEEEIRAKFRETLVKSNCLKEDDEIIKEYIDFKVEFKI